MSSDFLKNMLGHDFKDKDIVLAGNVKYLNGIFQYIKFDVDKPGKYYFDITQVWNASTGEVQKELPIQFTHGNRALDLNSVVISADGLYPDNTTDWHVTGANITNGGVFTKFVFPLGVFSQCGTYPFRFTITNTSTGQKETSHWMYFDVTPSATALATSWNEDIKPFDSDYTKWKHEVIQYHQQEIDYLTSLNESAGKIQQQLDSVNANINGAIDTALQKKLDSENTWTGKQHFNGGLIASTVGATNTLQGDNLNVNSSATLPINTSFGAFNANQIIYDCQLANGYSSMLRNKTAQANHPDDWNRKWWLWLSVLDLGQGKDFPVHIMRFDLDLDASDVGKPIAQFQGLDGNNAGTTQAVLGGQIQISIDHQGNLILEGVNGISGVHRYRFTAVF